MRLWLQNNFSSITALDISCDRLSDRHANVRSYVIEIATDTLYELYIHDDHVYDTVCIKIQTRRPYGLFRYTYLLCILQFKTQQMITFILCNCIIAK